MDNMYKIWMNILSTDDFAKLYEVEVKYTEEMEKWFSDFAPSKVFLNKGINSDSKNGTLVPSYDWLKSYKVDDTTMHDILAETRVFKSKDEIELMRLANDITNEGHVEVFKKIKPGMREGACSSIFRQYGLEKYNCKILPYPNICCAGRNCAVLHYFDNNKIIEDNELLLLDMGHSIHCYGADVTTTIPANGKFNEKQKQIYETVLEANNAVQAAMKPGVDWVEMHKLAERIILTRLKEFGIVTGEIEEMMEKRTAFLFMPHGLGHLIVNIFINFRELTPMMLEATFHTLQKDRLYQDSKTLELQES
jgi:Xaa-Pro dipeptidase